jgi:hypothetical protein
MISIVLLFSGRPRSGSSLLAALSSQSVQLGRREFGRRGILQMVWLRDLDARIERPQSYRGGLASGEIGATTTVETGLFGHLSLLVRVSRVWFTARVYSYSLLQFNAQSSKGVRSF